MGRAVHDADLPLDERDTGPGSAGAFDDDVGGLDDGHRQHPGFQAQLVDRFGGQQGDHPVGAGLDLHLCHHPVAHYPGDQPGEAVACRQRRAVSLLGGSLGGQVLGEPGQIRSGDRAVATGGPAGGQAPGIRPASDRVRADRQESRGFADAKLVRAGKTIKKARIRAIRTSVRAGARVRP